MNLLKYFFLFAYSVCSLSLYAQDCKVSIGTKTLYEPQQHSYAAPPAGYQPVFINHVGRHGARHLTKDLSGTVAYELLIKAESMHALTQKGAQLKKMVLLLQKIETPGLKLISQRGSNELQGIAERMMKNNENIFRQQGIDINVEVTKEVRTSQSGDAFLAGFHNGTLTSTLKKTIDDTALRFYDLSPAYLQFEKNGEWIEEIKTIRSANHIGEAALQIFYGQFFKKTFVLTAEEKEEFSKDIYGFAAIIPSITNEILQAGIKVSALDFRILFTCKQLSLLSVLDEAEDFLLKGPGSDTLGIQVKIAVPLLIQFIKTSDEFLNNGSNSILLRFAHAETIAPFASLMQISSASAPISKVDSFNKSWKADQIIPLSANIQWIFYRSKGSADLLIRFLLNEKEVSIKGMPGDLFPFYKWTDVRKFYIDLLNRLHISLSDQMGVYLSNVK